MGLSRAGYRNKQSVALKCGSALNTKQIKTCDSRNWPADTYMSGAAFRKARDEKILKSKAQTKDLARKKGNEEQIDLFCTGILF